MINLSFPHYALCRYTTIRRVLISSCIVTLMSVNNYYLQLLIQPLSFYYANYATLFIQQHLVKPNTKTFSSSNTNFCHGLCCAFQVVLSCSVTGKSFLVQFLS